MANAARKHHLIEHKDLLESDVVFPASLNPDASISRQERIIFSGLHEQAELKARE
jgi:hypothetical protein